MKGKIVLVARDLGPSQALQKIAAGATAREFATSGFLGHGKAVDSTGMAEEIVSSDLLLCGMSSNQANAESELEAAATAKKVEIPYGFYCDTWMIRQRTWAHDLIRDAAFLFVINEKEKARAKELFPNLPIFVTGRHSWEDYPKSSLTREESRAMLGVSDDEFLILSPGMKNPLINIHAWSSVIDAIGEIRNCLARPHLVLTPHPGKLKELNEFPIEGIWTMYRLFESMNYGFPVQVKIKNPNTSDVMKGADLVISPGSPSSEEEAGFLRLPLITVATANVLAESGPGIFELAEEGVSLPIFGSYEKLAERILEVLYEDISVDLSQLQAKFFGDPPPRGAFAEKAVGFLEEVLAKTRS